MDLRARRTTENNRETERPAIGLEEKIRRNRDKGYLMSFLLTVRYYPARRTESNPERTGRNK